MLLKVSLNFRLGSGLVPDDIPAPIWGLDSLNLYSARKKEKEKMNLIIITNYVLILKQMP